MKDIEFGLKLTANSGRLVSELKQAQDALAALTQTANAARQATQGFDTETRQAGAAATTAAAQNQQLNQSTQATSQAQAAASRYFNSFAGSATRAGEAMAWTSRQSQQLNQSTQAATQQSQALNQATSATASKQAEAAQQSKQLSHATEQAAAASRSAARNAGEMHSALSKTDRAAGEASSALSQFSRLAIAGFSVAALLHYGQTVLKIADDYVMLQGRLKLATESQTEFNRANAALFAIAQQNGVQLRETIELYSKLVPALRELGGTQEHALQMTDLVAKSLRLSGAGAAQSAAAILQFSQAMGSGVLRGDEFNSLMEASPRLMQALAAGLGVSISALRAMAEAGELTTDKVGNALLNQKSVVEAEFGQLPLTVSAAWVKMGNAITQEIGRMDKEAGGASTAIANALGGLAENINAVSDAFVTAAKVGVAVFVASLVSVRSAAIAAAGVAGIGALRTAIAGLMLLYSTGGLAAVAGALLGIGTAARTATAPVLGLAGALKALVWPVALAYGIYEFGKYAFENFRSVRLVVSEFVAELERKALGVKHFFGRLSDQEYAKGLQDIEYELSLKWKMEYAEPPKPPKEQAGQLAISPDVKAGKLISDADSAEKRKLEADIALLEGYYQRQKALRDFLASEQGKDSAQFKKAEQNMLDAASKLRELKASSAKLGKVDTPATPKESDAQKLAAEISRRTALLSAETEAESNLTEAQRFAVTMMNALQAGKIQLNEAEKMGLATDLEKLLTLDQVNQARKAAAEQEQEAQKAAAKLQQSNAAAQEESIQIINRVKLTAREYAEQLAFENSLIGKTALEVAILNEQRRIQVALEKELLALSNNDKFKERESNPEVGKAYQAAIEAARQAATEAEIAAERELKARDRVENKWETGARAAIVKYNDEIRNSAAQAASLYSSAFKKAEDALTQFAMTGKIRVGDLAQTIISEFYRINVAQPIVSAGSGLLGSLVSSLAGSLLGGSSAPVTASAYSLSSAASSFGLKMPAGARASGGSVHANSLYQVNERGPELLSYGGADYLMMGGRNGFVKPVGDALSRPASNPTSVVVQNNIQVIEAPGTQARVEQRPNNSGGMDFKVIVEQIEAGIARNVSGGRGPLADTLTQRYGRGHA